ncbi:MAG: ribosomal-processing cysteine protease Prp [Firmicutes bacterium]|nr:ribosomal-processing cysteine protease Prp [Bacillota bacterium]
MTKIRFLKDKTGLKGFEVKDHTGYASYGEDIVCAGISALSQTALLGLQKVLSIKCQVELKDGFLYCTLPADLGKTQWEQAQIVLRVLYEGIMAIKAEYGRYVSVKEVCYRENESSVIRHKKGRGEL